MKTAIVIGSNSDIAKGLMPYLQAEYMVSTWKRGYPVPPASWDLALIMIGSVAPVGPWHEVNFLEWEASIYSNLITPYRLLAHIWKNHNPGCSVCFMAGSNPQMIMPGYSAYNAGKMGLLKLVEQMDYETPDGKFFAVGPGTILTKIHQPTLDAGWDNPKLKAKMEDPPDKAEQIKRLWECIQWCVEADKEIVGGRNICVSDPWDDKYWMESVALQDWYKLRRMDETTTV